MRAGRLSQEKIAQNLILTARYATLYNRLGIDVLAGAVARHVVDSGRLVPKEAARTARLAPRGFLEGPASAHLKTESALASEG